MLFPLDFYGDLIFTGRAIMRERSSDAERNGGFGKFAASPYNNFIAICDADADGIFVSYTPDTLHYAGVNVYSLRLVATDGRLRRRTSRRGLNDRRIGDRLSASASRP